MSNEEPVLCPNKPSVYNKIKVKINKNSKVKNIFSSLILTAILVILINGLAALLVFFLKHIFWQFYEGIFFTHFFIY